MHCEQKAQATDIQDLAVEAIPLYPSTSHSSSSFIRPPPANSNLLLLSKCGQALRPLCLLFLSLHCLGALNCAPGFSGGIQYY